MKKVVFLRKFEKVKNKIYANKIKRNGGSIDYSVQGRWCCGLRGFASFGGLSVAEWNGFLVRVGYNR
jgi:hypothetical protein